MNELFKEEESKASWDDVNEVYNSLLEYACDEYEGDLADVDSEGLYDAVVDALNRWNEMDAESRKVYEGVEEYIRDEVDYEKFIPGTGEE